MVLLLFSYFNKFVHIIYRYGCVLYKFCNKFVCRVAIEMNTIKVDHIQYLLIKVRIYLIF